MTTGTQEASDVTRLPAADPRLVYFSGTNRASKKAWRDARNCGHGCDYVCKGKCDGKRGDQE